MRKPKMILFDYGQTLIKEKKYDGVAGSAAVMGYATRNKYGHTPEEVQAAADAINAELGRLDRQRRHLFQVEVPNHMFTAYLYQYMGIELSLTPQQIDKVFWDAASPGTPTDGIEGFLDYLKTKSIRTGVITNISYSPDVVKERIQSFLPGNDFEFILATSQYLFRKPNPRIFQLALEKAQLPPEDVWYIGDSYQCDVVGAKNAGLFPVWYTGAISAQETDGLTLIVSSWKDLMTMMEN